MLINPIMDELRVLGLEGMPKALGEQLSTPEAQELSFEERQGLMVDRKAIHRENCWLKNRLAKAKLRHVWPAWRTSTTGKGAAWTSHSSWPWPHAGGSPNTTICSSTDPPT
ncbi:hypothetical protein DFAR_710019 [Desulfarculales bacterium]